MFKWITTGHRNHKQKSKLNNSTTNNNNSNSNDHNSLNNSRDRQNGGSNASSEKNEKASNRFVQYPVVDSKGDDSNDVSSGNDHPRDQKTASVTTSQHKQHEQTSTVLHPQQISFRNSRHSLMAASRESLNDSNEYTTLENLHLQRTNFTSSSNAHNKLVEGDEQPPPLPHPRPQAPIVVGSQPNLHQCHSHDEVPGSGNELSSSLQTPGTCTLPRRSVLRNEPNERYRSPSNPPPMSRQPPPPPYSRHQPPEPYNRVKRPCQPPPPPRIPQGAFHSSSKQQSEPQHHHSLHDIDYRPVGLENGFKHSSEERKIASSAWPQKDPESSETGNVSGRRPEISEPQSLDANIVNGLSHNHNPSNVNDINENSFPSKSTEDLLNASRVARDTTSESHSIKRPCVNGSHFIRTENEIISSDSVYPNGFSSLELRETQRSTRVQDSPTKGQNYSIGIHSLPKDSGKRVTVQNINSEMTTFKPSKEVNQRMADPVQRICSQENQTKNYVMSNHCNSLRRDGNIFKSYGFPSESSCNQNYMNDTELYICEKEDQMESCARNGYHDNKNTKKTTETHKDHRISLTENGRVRSYPGAADTLTVRDYQSYSESCRQRGVEGGETKTNYETDLDREEGRKGDGCTSGPSTATSSSWMEWTQQLQAYVAWVNSQLRKKPDKQLITDLRRDFQNGVVFADLIEIIAGEKVAGINREAETLQLRRENLDRVLQFMAAKRIRMTHITSKEIAEGNLKSIMRVILALAAHYKPQSVREGTAAASGTKENVEGKSEDKKNPRNSQTRLEELDAQNLDKQEGKCRQPPCFPQGDQRQPKPNSQMQQKSTQQTQPQKQQRKTIIMHDVGVGPDAPLQAPDKTPNLTRRNMIDGGEDSSQGGTVLRRNPSLNSSTRPSSPSAPVYENLPRRAGQNRWAYDSLRASQKFYWNSSSSSSVHLAPDDPGNNPFQDSRSLKEDSINTGSSRGTSLNSSMDCDSDLNKDTSSSSLPFRGPLNKPAALEFWQELQGSERPNAGNMGKQSSEDNDGESPFKYHTIHRMSGRRKLPQIPGQSSSPTGAGHSRGTTPVGGGNTTNDISSSQGAPLSQLGSSVPSCRGGNNSDDSSREPEGRSQNSSPATSVVRGPVLESWRELVGLETSIDELKDQLKDHLKAQGQLGPKDAAYLHLFRSTTDCGGEGNVKSDEVMMDGPTSALRQEVLKHIIARRALESEKAELTRHLAQRDSLICDLRKQLLQKEKALQQQRNQFEEAIRNIQNGKPFRPFRGESPSAGRTQGREELQLVREAISALRSNFRGTDPNQHTLDTLEQAIAVLMERNSISNGDCNNVGVTKKEKRALNAQTELYTKVIYFTDRTVTPFMTCINKRLGEVTLRDFKNIFDRSGNFRFHFKSHDPEYGLVKEEIMNDDDTLPGVEGKIIAWVEEDLE